MMQSCASAAKLRGGGPILNRGSKTIVLYRVAATSVRHLQLAINRRATAKPSIRSSPWIRDAPHSGFSLLIR